MVRGDHEVNEVKLQNIYGAINVDMASEEDLERCGLTAGYISPIGLKKVKNFDIICDKTVMEMQDACCGANEKDKHYIHVNPARDFGDVKVDTIRQIQEGDVILALPSSGVHSNGFSLVRKVFEKEMNKEGLNTYYDSLGKTLGEALLAPTRIYVKALKNIKKSGVTVKACSHITGGGFYENVPRMLKDGVRAVIRKDSYPVPPIFKLLAEKGKIEEKMMYNTFNMGLGMVVAVDEADVDKTMAAIKAAGDQPYVVGTIENGEKGVTLC